ncbi:MAG TPA: CehA/McbA family metallohydrolase [Saprospiraceae bacterium]|nr:CehA/McbA family metallohydrolase [Saprospiraceae bacterium]
MLWSVWLICTVPLAAQPYSFYYGNIHAHSGYSDGNVDSTSSQCHTPAQDYAYANASAHFDYLGISDHNHSSAGMQLSDFHLGVGQAQNATQNGVFVALYGMEYGVINNGGHVLVYGIDSLIGWQSGNYDIYCEQYNYAQLFGIVNAHAGALCSLAHPNNGDFSNLDGSAYSSAADNAISGTCARNGVAFSTTNDYTDAPATSYETYLKKILSKGYHVAPSIDHDNHYTTFGRTSQGRTVVLANSLTSTDVLQALENMRYYASDDWNIEVNYTINGLYMGSVSSISANPTLSVSISDPDGENITKIEVFYGVPGSNSLPTVLTTANNTNTLTYTHSISVGSTYYYYLKIHQADGHLVWTAPIWVTKTSSSPIEWTDFHATPLKDRIRLDWRASLHDVRQFQAERSTDGLHYEPIGTVQTPEDVYDCPFTLDDLHPMEGLAFYRLLALDRDGTATYSPILGVNWQNPDLLLISAGPNPAADYLHVRFESRKEQSYWYFLYDGEGRELTRQPFEAVCGENSLTLAVADWPSGQYYLILGRPGKRIMELSWVKGE